MMQLKPMMQPVTTFGARYKSGAGSKGNVLAGAATSVGGAATLGSGVAGTVYGNPLGIGTLINVAVGLWNTWVGHRTVQNNGGLGRLKDPN